LDGAEGDSAVIGVELGDVEPVLDNFCDLLLWRLTVTGVVIGPYNSSEVLVSKGTGIDISGGFDEVSDEGVEGLNGDLLCATTLDDVLVMHADAEEHTEFLEP
jgi:hypothetical protein